MTRAMILRVPVSVAFGTDEEFDLRVRLERELAAALGGAGGGVGGAIGMSHLELRLDGVPDPDPALDAAKEVLARNGLLGRAMVVLETRRSADPDDPDCQVLWPPHSVGAYHAA